MAESEDSVKLDLSLVKQEIVAALSKCSQRGLMHSTKWLSELNFALKEYSLKSTLPVPSFAVEINEDFDHYIMAKSFFDLKEYDRCAFFTDWSQSPRNRFLHFYSRYLSGEKRKTDDMTDYAVPYDITQNSNLQELASDLRRRHSSRSLDGFELYLYGVVLKKLDLLKDAQEILLEAVRQEPLHWGGWLELSSLIVDRTKLDQLKLPDHWITNFFIGHAYLDLQLNDEALEIYWALQEKGFEKSNYITAQIAMIHHNKRDVDIAIQTFRQLEKMDPFRLDNLDTYSNLLYVKEYRVDLAHLAHKACEIDKYKVETCCVVGNYYSLRSEHQKAVVYFQRALKLNPHYLSAWTLMGHEFMEMKNTNAAIQSYRQAIEVNRRDYRAWYGLGQTYEILKMMFYCLYYYKQAQHLRPNDSRMLIALGETYEKLDKIQSAIKCYYKARGVGDIEGTALLKLAKLYDKLNEVDQAAAAYTEYVNDSSSTQIADKNEHSAAFKYLANYHVKRNLDDAHRYATSCLEFEETKEEAKALLRTIAQKRSQQESEAAEAEATAPLTRTRPRIADGAAANQVGPINLSFNC